MSEARILDIIEFVDKSSRVINLKIRLRMTALQFRILTVAYPFSINGQCNCSDSGMAM